jgi:hypothetical protein
MNTLNKNKLKLALKTRRHLFTFFCFSSIKQKKLFYKKRVVDIHTASYYINFKKIGRIHSKSKRIYGATMEYEMKYSIDCT